MEQECRKNRRIASGHYYFLNLDMRERWIGRKGVRTCLWLEERTMKEVT